MSTCDPNLPCEKCSRSVDDVQRKIAEQLVGNKASIVNFKTEDGKSTYDVVPKEQGCKVVMKDGTWLELDLSATKIKRLRRAKKCIRTEHEGEEYVLRCWRIKEIYPIEG